MAKDILISTNAGLADTATSNATSTVAEPSVAAAGSNVFMTGNWFASSSTDGGSTWQHHDPAVFLPSASTMFCCDQLVLFDAARGIWIWILQYRQDPATGSNEFRIAVSDTADFPDTWHWWDIAPAGLNPDWTDVWFDYPDAALSAGHLYVTFNVFKGDNWQRATVMKFPLDQLETNGQLTFSWWDTNEAGSLRLTQQGAPSGLMYFASNSIGGNRLRVFSWSDNETDVDWWDVPVDGWSRAISSIAPNGRDWLQRCDTRITAGTLGAGRLTFAWTAGASGNRSHAHVRVVVIDRNTMEIVETPDLWSSTRAWAYPAASTNAAGAIGITAFYGGDDRNPGMVVGARDDQNARWVLRYARLGSDSTVDGKWGDYASCRADEHNNGGWIASGFTLEGGNTRTHIMPRFVRFSMIETGLFN